MKTEHAAAPQAPSGQQAEPTPMVHQCCGREVCDGKDCPNDGPWYKVPKWRMDAYYYGFEPTGVASIDRILSAVACAGKAYHHTEEWREDAGTRDHLRGATPVEWIQNAAIDAALAGQQSERPAPAGQAVVIRALTMARHALVNLRINKSAESLALANALGEALAASQADRPAEEKHINMAAEYAAADATYEKRFPRVSERTEEARSMYRLGWWDRAWKAANPVQAERPAVKEDGK
jgi:hypothetical protein